MNAPRRATIHAIRPSDRHLPPAGAPGVVLGNKYKLERTIARGGMARVWRATHVTLNRPVAVKFVEAAGATIEERIDRFLKEAKVAASVRHKNVVDIIDFGTSASAEPYMVMELLEGETLDQRLMHGPMANDEVVSVSLQILSGLDAVHKVGIVHRDLKPGNVFLTADDEGVFARLLDFGISQGADDEKSDERMVVGTPEYMSPEQAFGDPLDARSDLYAVGVMLYEMLSGTVPFEHPDPQRVIEMVAHEIPPDLEALRPDVPELCRVVERAMAREPSERFESAREMRRAILEAVGGPPDTTGRHRLLVRDSRTSGITARATPSQVDTKSELEAAERARSSAPPNPLARSSAPPASLARSSAPPDPLARSSALPPSARAGPRAAIAIAVIALISVAGVIAWAASQHRAGPSAERAPEGRPASPAVPSSPAPTRAPARTEVTATPATPAAPESAAPRAGARLEADPAPDPARERPRGARGSRVRPSETGASMSADREPERGTGGIVRELDF